MEVTEILSSQKVLIPKLRFGEFKIKWTKMKLGDVAEKIQDGTHFSPIQFDQGNYKYITSKNIRNGYMDLANVPYLSDQAHKEIYQRCDVKFNDILLTKDGSATGTICLNELHEEFSLLSSVAFIRAEPSIAVNHFLYQYLAGPKGQYEIHSSIAGQAITRITLSKLRNYKCILPNIPEQKKIASFLSTVDEKIKQLSRKKELLEQYKKGVMQQFFSGKLRFKDEDGKMFPRWEAKKLGDIGDTFNGLTGKTKENFGEGKPYIQYMQIFSSSKVDVTKCGLVQIGKNENQPRVQYGDVFFTISSETPNEIGTCSVLLEEIEEMYLNSFCFGFRPRSLEQLVPDFASYFFRNEIFRKKIIKLAQGSTRYNMSKVQLLKLRVSLPSNNEQKKIANYLSSIDKKIEIVANQITRTQTFKKGLLQQMFV